MWKSKNEPWIKLEYAGGLNMEIYKLKNDRENLLLCSFYDRVENLGIPWKEKIEPKSKF